MYIINIDIYPFECKKECNQLNNHTFNHLTRVRQSETFCFCHCAQITLARQIPQIIGQSKWGRLPYCKEPQNMKASSENVNFALSSSTKELLTITVVVKCRAITATLIPSKLYTTGDIACDIWFLLTFHAMSKWTFRMMKLNILISSYILIVLKNANICVRDFYFVLSFMW